MQDYSSVFGNRALMLPILEVVARVVRAVLQQLDIDEGVKLRLWQLTPPMSRERIHLLAWVKEFNPSGVR